MGYVKTLEEIARIEDALASARWNGEWVSVEFMTRQETVERLLPPPLEPAPEPIATVTVGRWRSSCLGSWAGGVLSIAARHNGFHGGYVLVIYMDSEPPVVFGRELFGEPKKFATIVLSREGDHVHAWVDRYGRRLIDVHADVHTDLDPVRYDRFSFNYKSRTAAGGRGLEEDAILTRTRFAVDLKRQRAGTGSVVLGDNEHDPISELEIVEVGRVIYGEDEVAARCTPVARVPAEQFLPYHYGRQDNWLALQTLA